MPSDPQKQTRFSRRDVLAGGGALAALLATGGCGAKNDKQRALEELGIPAGTPHIVYVTINGCTADGGPHDYAHIQTIVQQTGLAAHAISLNPDIDKYMELKDTNGRTAPGQKVLASDNEAVLRIANQLQLFVDKDNRFRHSGLMLLFNERNEQISSAESKADPAQTIALFQRALQADQQKGQRAGR